MENWVSLAIQIPIVGIFILFTLEMQKRFTESLDKREKSYQETLDKREKIYQESIDKRDQQYLSMLDKVSMKLDVVEDKINELFIEKAVRS